MRLPKTCVLVQAFKNFLIGFLLLCIVILLFPSDRVQNSFGNARPITPLPEQDPMSKNTGSDIFTQKQQKFYASQNADRQSLLGSYLKKGASPKFGPYYNGLILEIVCPWLARVGNVNDGGKWTCNPWALLKNCVIYSLGVGPDITFETAMDKITEQSCKIYSFDPNPSLGQRLVDMKSDRYIFNPFKITSMTNASRNEYTPQDIMKWFNHNFIDYFKIDIEGSEFVTLPPLFVDKNKPVACQVFIEMHGTPAQCATLFRTFSEVGFWLFYYEHNGYHPNLAEYSFLHENCFAQYGVTNVLSRNFPSNYTM